MSDTKPHILVIEDYQPNAMLVCDLLSFHGFRVSWAPDGVAGLEMVTKEPPDLILMDMQMPRMDGYALTKHLKADDAYKAIPIVALTACAMVGDAEKALAAGCDGYMTKPVNTRELPQAVRRFLQGNAS
ncbi:MAG: response regulator [Ardenticatenales bacterium]|nr:response regulator [Ardenticatenales bacterium]